MIPYIPDRMEEGYGLNREAVAALRGQGVGLIVTVDCGITAVEEATCAASHGGGAGDHRPPRVQGRPARRRGGGGPPPGRLPLSLQVPGRGGGGPQAGVGPGRPGPAGRACWSATPTLAAIGTVADVMSLTGENRTIVRLGLEALRRTGRPGLRALLHEAGLDERPLTATAIGYTLAPRINASGRMGCASLAGELLLTERSRPGRRNSPGPCATSTGSGRPLEAADLHRVPGHGRGPAPAAEARPGAGRGAMAPGGGGHRGLPSGGEVLLPGVYDPPAGRQGQGLLPLLRGLQPVRRPGALRPPAGGLRRPCPGGGLHHPGGEYPGLCRRHERLCLRLYRRGGDGFRPGHRRGAGRCGPAHPGGSGGPGAAGALRRGQPKAGVLPVWLPGFRRERGGRRAAPEAEADRVRPVVRRHFLLGHRRGGRGGAGRPGGRGFLRPR